MSHSSKKSVIVAVIANSIVTVAKFVGFFFSGSGAMLSEAIHSVADTSNQALLLLGLNRSQKEADSTHPYGYGRARFFWGLVSALAIFFLGAGVTLYHGIHALMHPEPSEHSWITWAVLGLALVLEGGALAVATTGVAKDATRVNVGFWRYVKEGRDPTGIAVLLEDSAALFGLFLAIGGIALETVTHSPIYDAIATVLIGLLLAFVAIFLVAKNRVFLLTRAVDSEITDRVRGILEGDEAVEKVARSTAVIRGLDRYHLSAEVEFDGRVLLEHTLEDGDVDALRDKASDPEAFRAALDELADRLVDTVGDEVDRLEAKIREAVPEMKDVEIESD